MKASACDGAWFRSWEHQPVDLLSERLGIARGLCHLSDVVTCRAYRLQLSIFQALAAA